MTMGLSRDAIKADGLLLLVAIIWGFAFVAQRSGMAVIGPFAFNGVRFALGALSLAPILYLQRRREARKGGPALPRLPPGTRLLWAGGAGAVLFTAASLQQMGMVSTTAGNAGFITCFYVVLVPMVGLALGRAAGLHIWAGALLALAGLYLLSVGAGFRLAPGDLLELLGAFFWTGHILLIDRLGSRMEALEFSIGQFATCSALSLAAAVVLEPRAFAGLLPAAVPILYGGVMSVGVAYTLQVIAQRRALPAHASIILSMEALFAAIGGVLVLHEPLTPRIALGGLLMLGGMVCSQTGPKAGATISLEGDTP